MQQSGSRSVIIEAPQQVVLWSRCLRTFELYLNSDYSVSTVTVNVDPAEKEGSPAATSRVTPLLRNRSCRPISSLTMRTFQMPMEHSGADDGSNASAERNDRSGDHLRKVPGVACCASYKAELFKQLSPTMVSVLQAQFPTT